MEAFTELIIVYHSDSEMYEHVIQSKLEYNRVRRVDQKLKSQHKSFQS